MNNNSITFSSTECYDCAKKLQDSAIKLEQILNGDIKDLMEKAMIAYQSEGSAEIKKVYTSVQAKFGDFINSVSSCSTYLKEKVAPSYEAIERKVQQNVNI